VSLYDVVDRLTATVAADALQIVSAEDFADFLATASDVLVSHQLQDFTIVRGISSTGDVFCATQGSITGSTALTVVKNSFKIKEPV
jgi:hypothetical protein